MQFSRSPKKYRLFFEGPGFRAEKTIYAPGDAVEVSYMPATDTDYRFYSDDTDFEQDYDPARGILLCFTMPEHDVRIGVKARNTMTSDRTSVMPPLMVGGIGGTGSRWYCPECGTENHGKFCTKCGNKRPK